MFLEKFAINLFFVGLAIVGLGYLWVVWRAVRVNILWLLALLPPIWLIFLCVQWKRARRPLMVFGLGAAVIGAAYALNAYAIARAFEPHEAIVDGELRLTLTKAKDFSYSMLRNRPDVALLQMANPDVTDETLAFLEGMTKLYSLDLNDTQVSDAGLKLLKELPALKELRIKGTKVTEAGFKEHLGGLERLESIDIRKLGFSGNYVRSWLAAKEGRKALR